MIYTIYKKESMMHTIKPKFRFNLKSKIIEAGYKNIREFADESGVGLPKLSRIIRGWEIPSTNIQNKMARALGMSLENFQKLL
jgi:hypothetical protein